MNIDINSNISLDSLKKTEPLSTELKQSNKILNLVPPPYNKPISDKLLAHIHADFLITGSNLEGNTREDSLHAMVHWLTQIKNDLMSDSHELDEALTLFEHARQVAVNIQNMRGGEPEVTEQLPASDPKMNEKLQIFVQELIRKIEKLQPEETLLLPGGWNSTLQGHAISYVVERVGDTYDFHVYNSGDGISAYHLNKWDEKGYFSYPPVYSIKGISKENILNPLIYQALYDLLVYPVSIKDVWLVSHILYQLVFPSFGGEITTVNNNVSPFMRAQRSGTCSWKVLVSFLKDKLKNSPKTFKTVKIYLKILSFRDYWKDHSLSSLQKNVDKSQLILIKNSLEKLTREIRKENHNLSVKQKEEFLQEIISYQAQVSEALEKKDETISIPFSVKNTGENAKAILAFPALPMASLLPSSLTKTTSPVVHISLKPFTENNIQKQLNECSMYCQKLFEAEEYSSLILFVNRLFKELPFPQRKNLNNLWDQLPQDQKILEDIMSQISFLNTLLFKSCFQVGKSTSDETASSVTSFCILEKLFERILQNTHESLALIGFDLNLSSQYAVNDGHLRCMIETHAFAHDVEQYKRMLAAKKYLRGGCSIQHFIHEVIGTNSTVNFPQISLKDDIKAQYEDVRKQAESLYGIDPNSNALILALKSDYGKRKLLPPYVATMNLQSFYTSYFLNGLLFSDADQKIAKESQAFDIGGESIEELKHKESLSYYELKTDAWITGLRNPNPVSKVLPTKIYDTVSERFQNPVFRELARDFFDSKQKNPNKALIETVKDISEEEKRELLTLLNTSEEMIVWQTFSFFSRYWDRLQSTDYQLLFEMLCLNALTQEWKKNPQHLSDLLNFLKEGLEQFEGKERISSFLFLVKIGVMVQNHCVSKGQTDIVWPDWSTLIKNKLILSDLSSNDIQALHFAQAFVLQKQNLLNPNSLSDLIIGKALGANVTLPFCLEDSWINPRLQNSLETHKDQIRKAFADPHFMNSCLNKALNLVFQASPRNWKTMSFPVFEDESGEFQLNILTGQFFQKDSLQTSLPKELREKEDFKKIFKDNIPSSAKLEGGIRYYFSEKGVDYRIQYRQGRMPLIERKIEKQWYRYIPEEYINGNGSYLSAACLRENYTHWIDLESGKVLFLDKAFKVACEAFSVKDATGNWIIDKINKKGSSGSLILLNADPQISPELKSLNLFESKDYIKVWKDDQGIQEIELDRYGLHFKTHADDKGHQKAFCEELKEFYIADKQEFTHHKFVERFLLLQNQSGKRVALLPVHAIQLDISQEVPLAAPSKAIREVPYRWVKIELNEKGEPIHLSKEQALYLSYLALTQKDYTQAHHYLQKALKNPSKENDQNLIKMINWILASQDNHPQALAIILRASLMLLENEQFNGLQFQNLQRKYQSTCAELAKLYDRYHQGDNHATFAKLSLEEEKRLLQILFNQTPLSEQTFYRLSYLNSLKPLIPGVMEGNWVRDKSLEENLHAPYDYKSALGEILHIIINEQSTLLEGQKGYRKGLLTRAGSNMACLLIDYCLNTERYQSSPLKETLQMELKMIEFAGTLSGKLLRDTLKYIINHQASFEELMTELKLITQKIKDPSPNRNQAREIAQIVKKMCEKYLQMKKNENSISSLKQKHNISTVLPEAPIVKTNEPLKSSAIKVANLSGFVSEEKHPLKEKMEKISSEGITHPTVKTLIHEFNDQLEGFYQSLQKTPPTTIVLTKSPKEVASFLQKRNHKNEKTLEKLKTEILNLAHTTPTTKLSVNIGLEKAGGLERKLSFEDLTLLFLRDDVALFAEGCPGLNSEGIKELNQKILDYLVLATHQQQIKRAEKILTDLPELETNVTSDPMTKKDHELLIKQLIQNLCKELKAERAYKPEQKREYIIFEYMSDMLLRKEQVDTIDLLYHDGNCNIESAETELIVQLIMGSGKSKVLLPILALKKANGYNLSMIIVPASLYGTNKPDMQRSSINTFNQAPVTFEFDRNTPFTEDTLRQKLWDLQNCIVNRRYVITTAESIQCLHEKYDEMLKIDSSSKDYENCMQLMDQIINLIKTRGHALIDEADTILDSRREVNFPIGPGRPVGKDRISLVLKLFEIILSEPIASKINFKENKQEAVDLEVYKNEIRPLIVELLMKSWDLSGLDSKQVKAFLCGELENQELPGLDKHPQRQMISLAKEYLTPLLMMALKKNGNENFGLTKLLNILFAIPFKGNNNPDERSQFGNVYETLMFTDLIYWQDGLKKKHVTHLIQETQRKTRIEAKEKQIPLNETSIAREFCQIFGVKNLFNITAKDEITIGQSVGTSYKALSYWLEHYCFPEIKIYLQRINSTSQDFVDYFAHVQGFTGTPWNKLTYHPRLIKPEMESKTSNSNAEMAILHAIWNKVEASQPKGKQKIHAISTKNIEEILSQLLSDMNFECLIDVGALLRGISNEQVAKAWEKKLKEGNELGQGIIYFNENNEIVVKFEGEEPVLLDVSKIVKSKTYYDQVHGSGADIKQKPLAKARLTFANNTVRDLSQGGMRLRELLSSQDIEIKLPDYIAKQLDPNSQPLFKHLLRHALIQQGQRLGDDMVRSTKHKIKHLVKQEIRDLIFQQKVLVLRKQIDRKFEPLLTEVELDDPYLEYGRPIKMDDSLKVLQAYRDKQQKIFNELSRDVNDLDKTLHPAIENMKKSVNNKLTHFQFPPQELLPAKQPIEDHTLRESKVEVLKEVEVKKQLRVPEYTTTKPNEWLNKQSSTSQPDFFVPKSSLVNTPKVKTIEEVFNSHSSLMAFQGMFDPQLTTTENFIKSVEELNQLAFEPNVQKKAYQVVLIKESGKPIQALMVDPYEVGDIRKILSKKSSKRKDWQPPNRQAMIFDLTNRFCETFGSPLEKEDLCKADELIVQAKFYNGYLIYTPQEFKYLQKWISTHPKASLFKELFEKIVAAHPGLDDDYQRSKLKSFLVVG